MKDQFSEQFQEAAKKSLSVLTDYLASDGNDENAIKKARVASSVLASHQRFEATKSSREKTIIGLARSLARDRDQLAEYVKITMPDQELAKALPEPEKKD